MRYESKRLKYLSNKEQSGGYQNKANWASLTSSIYIQRPLVSLHISIIALTSCRLFGLMIIYIFDY